VEAVCSPQLTVHSERLSKVQYPKSNIGKRSSRFKVEKAGEGLNGHGMPCRHIAKIFGNLGLKISLCGVVSWWLKRDSSPAKGAVRMTREAVP
jgi:hypothetical protein